MADDNRRILKIKYMVCPRCITVVREVLEELGLTVFSIELGEAVIEKDDSITEPDINKKMKERGFELIGDRKQEQVEKIKHVLREYLGLIEDNENPPVLSGYLSRQLHQNYSSLSSTFSETEDVTIEKYLIHLKINRVKSLLETAELTLSEMAWKLNYSSAAHLSGQFKQVTGCSPTEYQKLFNSTSEV